MKESKEFANSFLKESILHRKVWQLLKMVLFLEKMLLNGMIFLRNIENYVLGTEDGAL